MDVRALLASDRAAWNPLWQGYLEFYRVAISPEVTELTWARFLNSEEPLFALGAFVDERLIGFAHYLLHRSTWSDGPYCYLEDLFVAPDERGHGAGRLLIEAVESEARNAGATQLYWLTHETNLNAMALYDRLARRTGFLHYSKKL